MDGGGGFTRELNLKTRAGAGGVIVVTVSLRDRMAERPVHYFDIEAEVGAIDGEILAIRGEMLRAPYDECRAALSRLDLLVGERVVPGFTQRVRDILGSGDGCAHLQTMAMNLGRVVVPGRAAYARAVLGEEEAQRIIASQAAALGLPGSCPAWSEDGPIMRRMRGEDPGG
jgi:hypothetical protein